MSRHKSECAIVGEKQIERLMRKYLGLESSNLSDDEREIILFALYMESLSSGGIGAKATAEGDALPYKGPSGENTKPPPGR